MNSPLNICDRISENLPFGHKQTFEKLDKNFLQYFLKLSFCAHLDKANIFAVKFQTNSFFFLGGMDDYIRSTDTPKK